MQGRSRRTGKKIAIGYWLLAIGQKLIAKSQRHRDEKGVALISVLILLFFFTSLGASLMALVFSRLQSVILETDRLKAEYLAEAGMAKALYERTTGLDPDANGIGNIAITYFGAGLFVVNHDPKGFSLLSTGYVHDVKRVSFIKYATQ